MRGGRRRRAVLKIDHAYAESCAVRRATPTRSQDRGLTLVEILITIALMSIVVVSVVVALRVSTVASRVDEDHANIYAWLQDASGRIQQESWERWEDCTATDLLTRYDTVAKTEAVRPSGWPGSATIAVTQVQFLAAESWGATPCAEDRLQKVTITATGPGGMRKTLEMVKSAD
jgi:prepilin-type N-terminal cleavage/methylation domain-containing protein